MNDFSQKKSGPINIGVVLKYENDIMKCIFNENIDRFELKKQSQLSLFLKFQYQILLKR